MEKFYEIDELIAKVLADEATAAERRDLEKQVAESPDLQRYFEQMKRIWLASDDASNALDVDTEAAWVAVKTRLHEKHKPLTVSWLRPKTLLRVAAAMAVLMVAAVWLLTKNPEMPPLSIVSENQVLTEKLTDGSTITLNKKTELTADLNSKERRVKLKGEAYFEVAHDTTKPFFIEVGQLEIRVVGTAFNVDAQSTAGKILVSVAEGKVLLRGRNGAAIYLTKGQNTVFDNATGNFETETTTKPNVAAYKSRELIYDATPLKTVVAQINEFYGSNIVINSADIENYAISGRYNFDKTSLEDVLQSFQDLYSIDVQKQADGRILLNRAYSTD